MITANVIVITAECYWKVALWEKNSIFFLSELFSGKCWHDSSLSDELFLYSREVHGGK